MLGAVRVYRIEADNEVIFRLSCKSAVSYISILQVASMVLEY